MSEARLEGLRRELAAGPRDPGVWAALGRACARADRLPGWLAGAEMLRDLCHAWIASPEEPAMRELLLRLLDWDEVDQAPVGWWEEQGRLERQGDRCYDLATGLPLAARRRRDGAVVLLVPEGPFPRGRRSSVAEDSPWVSPPDHWEATPLDPFYLDRDPVTVERFARFPGQDWRPGAAVPGEAGWEAQLPFPGRPVVGVTWEGARAYAAWVGGVLPLELEWERAATGDHRRTFPFASGRDEVGVQSPAWVDADLVFDRYYHDEFASLDRNGPYWNWSAELEDVGSVQAPFGHRDMAGNAAEWCADRRDEGAATKGGSWRSPRGHLAICHTEWVAPEAASPCVGFRVAHRLFGPQPSLFG